MTLISMCIKTVPQAVLQTNFGTISKTLLDLLATHGAACENPSLVRCLIGCLSHLLRAQSAFGWSQNSTGQVYKSVLTFVCHGKPKIRKAAQHAVCAILKGSLVVTVDNPPEFHPAAAKTAKECLEKLTLTSEVNNVLHILILLKEIISVFPQNHVKTICDAVLGLMQSKAHPHMTTCGMQMLYGLFNSRPATGTLSEEMNAKLISGMYEYKPSINDSKAIIAWLTVQQEAMINLSQLSPDLCLAHMPRFFDEVKKCWGSDRKEVTVAATTALKAVCNECVKPNIDHFVTSESLVEKLNKVFAHVQDGFSYQYHKAWAQVLHLMAVIFDVAGSHCQEELGKLLPSLAERRNAENFAFENELDFVVGKAIRKMGPQVVLKHIDLQITGEEESLDFPRSWLLPVLRENIQNTELSFFIDYFYPLAESCRLRSHRCLNKDDRKGEKIYSVLEHQIWLLLPGFCNCPTDLTKCFRSLAKTLGEQLNKRKDLRIDIMASLRQLILKNMDNEENRSELAGFAKNYLPILYNIYTKLPSGSEETGQRLAAYETIKMYLKIAPKELALKMFDNAFNLYTNESGFMKEAILDILRAQLAYQDVGRIQKLYEVTIKQLTSKDHKEQKKSYKILDELCCSESEACTEFVFANFENLQKVFLQSLAQASPSSQASRIRCLTHIVRKLDEDHRGFISNIIPEVVLCVKANNKKARDGAFTLLVVIGEVLLKLKPDGQTSDDVIHDYMEILVAGLAGSPNSMHCALTAITRVYYEFKDIFPEKVSESLVHNVCLLVTSQAREVVGASLCFLRVFIQANPVEQTTPHVQGIVEAIVKMTEDCKKYFRLRSRYLMDRLVKKFGFDLVSGLIPKNDHVTHKRLNNIRKMQARKEKMVEKKDHRGGDSDDDDESNFRVRSKQKTMDEILADSDSDYDEMESEDEHGGAKPKQHKKKVKKGGAQTFIADGSEGIVDFLDPSAARAVTSVKPKTSSEKSDLEAKKSKDKLGGFKIAPDGRLIIKDTGSSDSEDDEEKETSQKMHSMMIDSDEEGEKSENTFKALVASNAARKRKLGGSVASSRRTAKTNASTSEPAMKYQAGGSGIHRPTKATPDYGSEYRSTKAKGDVKRKGKPDPYAYVPLNKSSLNKRKRAKHEGQFKNLVKGAQAGADAGAKQKARKGQRN